MSLIVSFITEQKEKLTEVEQQLKKAEAAQRRRIQNEKAARDTEVCLPSVAFCCRPLLILNCFLRWNSVCHVEI